MGGRRVDDLDAVLRELEPRLGPPTADPEALGGGITNRNYRVRFSRHDAVVRLAGKDTSLLGIDRMTEWHANRIAAGLGIAPRVLASGEGWLATEYMAGTPCDAASVRTRLKPTGEALREFHDSRAELSTRFWVPELLDEYARVVRDRGGNVPSAYSRAQELVARIAELLPLSDPVPCHNDLLPANILRVGGDDAVMLVDWEYAGMGHRYFDLGNLAAGSELGDTDEKQLLEAYLRRSASGSELAALRLMRIVSDAREAAWGMVQSVVSELDFDFSGYATAHFKRLASAAESPRLKEWLNAAAA